MSDFRDDPILTAYVLGEVNDAQRADIDAAMAADPALAEYVRELREATELLASELGEAPVAGLTDIEKQQLLREASTPAPSVRPSRRRYWIAAASSIAAIAAAALLLVQTSGKKDKAMDSSTPGTVEQQNETSRYSRLENRPNDGQGTSSGLVGAQLSTGSATTTVPESTVTSRPVAGGVSANRLAGSGYHASDVNVGDLGLDPHGKKARLEAGDRLGWGNKRGGVEATGEGYDEIVDNDFIKVSADPQSTFSIDVDTGSYSNIRRFLTRNQLPPKGAVRIEEMINYFDYDYSNPEQGEPFSVRSDVTAAPWNPDHRLVRVSLKGRELATRPTNNLVFLLDVSGSMSAPNKLPLLRRAMALLVDKLGAEDRIAIVVYAGASGVVLPSTSVANKHKIMSSLEKLNAGGSTNAGAGIELAYRIAIEQFIEGGNNRVILATDGDFNVGTTSRAAMLELIAKKARSNVFLTVLGFGMGNYKDGMLEQVANKGNGHYAYIDTINEARKVLVHDLDATLVTIAKDVKLQIEFNPKEVSEYRLIGYENRVMAHHEFNDDTKDAGEIGAGHRVTALYEIVPTGRRTGASSTTDPLRYQSKTATTQAANSGELLSLKLRFKRPDGDKSVLREYAVRDGGKQLGETSADFRFAASVAAFGMLLRDSKHKGSASYAMITELAAAGAKKDRFGYRSEFVQLVAKARRLAR